MELQEIKEKVRLKVLLHGNSGYGKTYQACRIAIQASKEGQEVLYVDTESEGSVNIVELVEGGEFDEEDVENIEYVQVEDDLDDYDTNFDALFELVKRSNQEEYDLVVVDTLDHKHSYALEKVFGAKKESEADWNEYTAVYDVEKQMMEEINKPKAHIVATIDPSSAKSDKPKGAQVNVRGYFNVVLDMQKSSAGEGSEWSALISNFVGESDNIGKSATGDKLNQFIDKKIVRRIT